MAASSGPLRRRLAGSVTVFRRDEKNDIDYVLVPDNATALAAPLSLVPRTCTTPTSPGCIYQARNLNALSFTGVEVAVRWQVTGANQVSIAYTSLYGAQQALNGLLSRYLFNYPVNNASMQWQSRLPGKIQLRTRVGVTERYNNDPYALWDLASAGSSGTCVLSCSLRIWPTLLTRRLRAWRCRDARFWAGSRWC